ncbi:EAL domain-containing protein [Halomonas beimenensis]|uniref:Diguanylate cyclase/phosphodiesterase (GGDEF & EAL domains) with PAS/PAC sensor(S) n=1 Tax=Halomonas beimenensis TaxID=475662 RepID=A0A291P8G9_9GAMM|nr:EAL domain-containing protein [Halomonas beimenensis]ATJ83158.1 diguanylate cyclase/phosphodiesterase (GGDEF & EAL domains) with PAS/PAC sensor(s) [Halomonas beimenensis]
MTALAGFYGLLAALSLTAAWLLWRRTSVMSSPADPEAPVEPGDAGLQRAGQLEQALREALARDTPFFELYLQPQHRLVGGELVGAEVLIRWQDERFGSVSPGEFIPLAEATGLIIPLDRRVLEASLAWLAALPAEASDLSLSVNCSIRHFTDLEFPGWLNSRCRRYSIDPARLEIELTEHVAFEDLDTVRRVMSLLRHHGFGIALDDFGTGYTSLSFLQRLPFSKVKLDKAFIDPIDSQRRSRVLVQSLITMAEALGLEVVAEGIEDRGQLELLQRMGCPVGQGYLLGRPVPADRFLAAWLGGAPPEGARPDRAPAPADA